MRLPGERVRRTRWVHTDRVAVAIEVEAVIPPDDPRDACFEPETVQLLRQVRERAEAGNLDWLRQHGRVHVAA